jgi:hypothetical protein
LAIFAAGLAWLEFVGSSGWVLGGVAQVMLPLATGFVLVDRVLGGRREYGLSVAGVSRPAGRTSMGERGRTIGERGRSLRGAVQQWRALAERWGSGGRRSSGGAVVGAGRAVGGG